MKPSNPLRREIGLVHEVASISKAGGLRPFFSSAAIDRVEVVSRRAGSDEAWKWTSDGKGSYELAPTTREKPGTDITLHIKEDADEFLDSWRLQEIIRKWADHIAWPVTIVKDGEESPANEGTALWRKPKSEVTEEQYNEFYRHISHNFDTPWDTLHWRAEGTIEFSALLFIPGSRPFEFGDRSWPVWSCWRLSRGETPPPCGDWRSRRRFCC